MRSMSRVRMVVARRPWLYWLAVGLLAAGCAAAVAGEVRSVDRTRSSWGDTTPVWVSTRSIGPGERLDGGVATRDLPRALVPPTAVHRLATGATATQRIDPGEVIVGIDVALGGPLALLPDGWMALTLDVPGTAGSLGSAGSAGSAGTTGPPLIEIGRSAAIMSSGQVVAPRAIILGISASGVDVGVPSDVVAAVADASARGSAVLAVVAVSASRQR